MIDSITEKFLFDESTYYSSNFWYKWISKNRIFSEYKNRFHKFENILIAVERSVIESYPTAFCYSRLCEISYILLHADSTPVPVAAAKINAIHHAKSIHLTFSIYNVGEVAMLKLGDKIRRNESCLTIRRLRWQIFLV